MKKWYLVVAVVLVFSLMVATACGGAAPASTVTVTKTASAAPASTVTVTAAAATVTQTAAPVTVTVTPTPAPTKLAKVRQTESIGGTALFFIAVGQGTGIFKKWGIEVEPMPMATGAARTAFYTGQSDVSGADPTLFYDERKDTRIFTSHMNVHFSVMVRKDSPYRSLQDLKGKKIATVPPSAASFTQAWYVILKLEGLKLEDFVVLNGDNAVMAGWLLKGDVEAALLNEPFPSKLLVSDGDKLRELAWMNDLYKKHTGYSWLYGGLYTLEKFVKENEAVARAYGKAWDEVQTYIYGHDDIWKSDLAKKQWAVEDPAVLERLAQRMPGTVEHPPYGPAYKKALVKREQFIADLGMVKQEVVDWLKEIIIFAD